MMMSKKKATIWELKGLAGLLNFLTRAIYLGRAFTRCMYAKFSGWVRLGNTTHKSQELVHTKFLKQHHHVRLDAEFKNDCKVWAEFLDSNDSMSYCHPYVDLSTTITAEILDFYTDAAKGKSLGFGGSFGPHWLFGQWEPGFIEENDPSIEFLELYAVCISVFAWCQQLKNQQVILFCDNQAVVNMINNTSAKCPHCMQLIRKLTLKSRLMNMHIFARWVRGVENQRADLLSRQKVQQFWFIMRNKPLDTYSTELPKELWSLSKIWVK